MLRKVYASYGNSKLRCKFYLAHQPIEDIKIFYSTFVFVISKFLERHSKLKRRAPAYSRALRQINGVVQRVVHGRLRSDSHINYMYSRTLWLNTNDLSKPLFGFKVNEIRIFNTTLV